MSEYHNREAFERRMAERAGAAADPSPLGVFYHVSCMGNWRKVVREQLRLCHHVGLAEVHVGITGSVRDILELRELAGAVGVSVEFVSHGEDLGAYEGPTLRAVWKWACEHPSGAVLYFHTKGVSAPSSAHKKHWRRLMGRQVISEWRRNLTSLRVHDVCGVSWQELPDFPHFTGNFWAARSDWVSHLQEPQKYRRRHPNLRWAGHSWDNRMYVETWLGSEQWHHVDSLVCKSSGIWDDTNDEILRYSYEVPGFSYKD